jgi:hypothetical protein
MVRCLPCIGPRGIFEGGFGVKKVISMAILVITVFSVNLPADALIYQFSAIDKGGIGSGAFDVSISGNELTIVINNTSITPLNAPALDGITTASLTMLYDQNIPEFTSPFMRMQNVGKDGEGSIELYGITEVGSPVPEPTTLLLLGLGLIGIGIILREMF